MPTDAADPDIPYLTRNSGGHTQMALAETQDGRQGFVDTPLLFGSDVTDQIAKPIRVDGTNLLDQHPGDLAEQIDFGAERRGPGTVRRGRDKYH